MRNPRSSPGWRDSNQIASGKPGAVQWGDVTAMSESQKANREATDIEWDRRLRLYENHLRRIELDVLPMREGRLKSRETAADLAQLNLKSLFILNGGALVALPALLQVANNPTCPSVSGISWALGWFVFGLTSISVSNLCAFFHMQADNFDAAHKIASTVKKLNAKYERLVGMENVKTDEQIQKEEKQVVQSSFITRNGEDFFWWAVWLGVLSLLGFVAGAISATRYFIGCS